MALVTLAIDPGLYDGGTFNWPTSNRCFVSALLIHPRAATYFLLSNRWHTLSLLPLIRVPDWSPQLTVGLSKSSLVSLAYMLILIFWQFSWIRCWVGDDSTRHASSFSVLDEAPAVVDWLRRPPVFPYLTTYPSLTVRHINVTILAYRPDSPPTTLLCACKLVLVHGMKLKVVLISPLIQFG